MNILEPAQLAWNRDGQPAADATLDIAPVHVFARSSGGRFPEVDGLILAIAAAHYGEPAAADAGVVRGHDAHADGRGDDSVSSVALVSVSIRPPLANKAFLVDHTPRTRAFRPISEHVACSDATPPLDKCRPSASFEITAGRTEALASAAKIGRARIPRMARAEQVPILTLDAESVLWLGKSVGIRRARIGFAMTYTGA